jgi:hypothetical protein
MPMVWIDQDATAFHILSSTLVILPFDAILIFAVVMQRLNEELTIIFVIRDKEHRNYVIMSCALLIYAVEIVSNLIHIYVNLF